MMLCLEPISLRNTEGQDIFKILNLENVSTNMLEIEHFVEISMILRDQWVTQKIGDIYRDDLRSSIWLDLD